MLLKDRVSIIIKENKLKQKEFAAIIGVTESYISAILSGRNANLSVALANLIEEKLGYSSQWVLTGDGNKLKQVSKNQNLSDEHRRAIMQLEKMPDEQVRAVLAFIDSLEKVESAFKEKTE